MHLFTAHRLHLAPIAALLTVIFPGSLPAATPVSSYKIVAEFPHSTGSYTEGFFYRDGLFFEGTGLKGNSAILVIEPESGKVLQRRNLPEPYFGEGIVDWGPDI
jgi:glutamine cyclotransferase